MKSERLWKLSTLTLRLTREVACWNYKIRLAIGANWGTAHSETTPMAVSA